MSLTKHFTQKLNLIVNNFNSVLEEIIRRSLGQNGFSPVLAGCIDSSAIQPSNSGSSNFDLKGLLEQGIVWYCPVPKKRTTAESKLTEKFLQLPHNRITKYATPKTNIIACLDCGDYHEIGTICGKCYEKVKTETKKLQDQMFETESFQYQHPTKEVAFVYENEKDSKETLENMNRVVVEVKRERPSWFSNSLLTKLTTK